MSGSFLVSYDELSGGATPGASAVVDATVNDWSNSDTITCTQVSFDSATFSSNANEAAWQSAGLSVRPSPGPTSSCVKIVAADPNAAAGNGAGVVDVSSLPTTPSALEHALESGTTGIPGIDQFGSSAFGRAVGLLIAPTVGATPQFSSALLEAMSTLPGIQYLGQQSTHSGETGLGFSGSTDVGTTTVVLSQTTGALLEARNVDNRTYRTVVDELNHAFGAASGGGTNVVTAQWLDAASTPPQIVASLPADVNSGVTP
jgi:hypothetical protein